jgi:hypothetical protein
MALARVKNWGIEVLTDTDQNAEFDNIVNYFGSIDNGDIDASAAIVASKLDLTSGTGRFVSSISSSSPALQITTSSTGDLIKLIDGATTVFQQADGGAVSIETSSGAALTVNNTGTGDTLDFQDGGSSVLTIANGGAVSVSPDVWEQKVITILPTAFTLPSSNAPALTLVEGTNQTFYALAFDKDTDESAWITFGVPDYYESGTAVTFKIKWRANATANDVMWAVDYIGTDEGEDTDAATSNVAFSADTTNGTANYMNEVTKTQAAPWALGDQAVLRVYRDANHASDTLAVDAELLSFEIIFNGE